MGARPHVVIIGAGFGGLTAAKRLEHESVDVTLIDRHNYHSFQPLLYQVATAGLNAADVAYAVRGLFRRQQRVLFRKAEVSGVDWDGRTLLLRDEPPMPFDHLIVAAGSSTNYFGVPGAAEFAFPLYGLEDAVRVRNHLLSLFEAAESVPGLVDDGVLNLVIVGGGPTGVEVAGAMAELVDKVLRQDFHDLDVRRTRVILLEQAPHLLAPFTRPSRQLRPQGPRGARRRRAPRHRGHLGEPRPPDPRRRDRDPEPSRAVGRGRQGVDPGRHPRRHPGSGRAHRRGPGPVDPRPPRRLRRGRRGRHRRPGRRAAAATGPGRHAGRHPRRRAGDGDHRASSAPTVPLLRQGNHGHHRAPRRGGRAAGWDPAHRPAGLVRLAGPPPALPAGRAQPGVGGHQLGLELLHLGPRAASDPATRGAAPHAPSDLRCDVIGASGRFGGRGDPAGPGRTG